MTYCSLPDAGHKIFGNFVMYIGFQQGQAHFTHGRVDIALREFAAATQLVENTIQALSQILEHKTPKRRLAS